MGGKKELKKQTKKLMVAKNENLIKITRNIMLILTCITNNLCNFSFFPQLRNMNSIFALTKFLRIRKGTMVSLTGTKLFFAHNKHTQ